MTEGEKVSFPYSSLEEARLDHFEKLGGPEKAFRLLVKGYKTYLWRKRADSNAKRQDSEADAMFIAENPRASAVLKVPAPPIKKPSVLPKEEPRASAAKRTRARKEV